jgi:integral membrane sensor domain MASE1
MMQLFALPRWLVALLFIGAYVLLDYVSFVFPLAPFGFTPWNPSIGLSFAVILLGGRQYLPLLFIAPFIADLLLRQSLPLWVQAIAASVIGVGYCGATMVLIDPRLRFDPTLSSLRDLFILLLVAGVSSGLVALIYAAVFVLAGLLTWQQYPFAALHHWVGDAIGIFVVTPFLLSLFTTPRFPRFSIEMGGQLAAIGLAFYMIFGFDRAAEYQFFYLLFLPIVWIAARYGLEGVSVGLFVIQAGLIGALDWSNQVIRDVTKFQLLMLVLALNGLFLGVAKNEQRRTQTRLRLHQEALDRASRLSSLSALAATLAHEVNQPLTALSNYLRLVRDMLESGEDRPPPPLSKHRKRPLHRLITSWSSSAICGSSCGQAKAS